MESRPALTVLVPTDPLVGTFGYARDVLGPSPLIGADIASVGTRDVKGHWVVDIRFRAGAEQRWERFARQNFHRLISVDLSGKVLATTLIEPGQRAFSPGPALEVSDALTAVQARDVAVLLDQGSFPVALTRVSETVVSSALSAGL